MSCVDPGCLARPVPAAEIIVVTRTKLHLRIRLECDSSIAIEFQFIQPRRSFRELVGPQQEHRFDKRRACLCGRHVEHQCRAASASIGDSAVAPEGNRQALREQILQMLPRPIARPTARATTASGLHRV